MGSVPAHAGGGKVARTPIGTPADAIARVRPMLLADHVSAFAWMLIGLPLLIAWAVGLVDLLSSSLPRQTKAAWVLIIVLLPILGTILYFALRRPSRDEVRRSQAAAAETHNADPRSAYGPHPPID